LTAGRVATLTITLVLKTYEEKNTWTHHYTPENNDFTPEHNDIIIIIIIIINEKINVAFSPKTTRTRNIPKKRKNDMFGR